MAARAAIPDVRASKREAGCACAHLEARGCENSLAAGREPVTVTERIVPLDRARSFITLLVVLHHSVINYTYFGNADRMRWLGFDLIVLFNDSFFMACMFSFLDCSFATAWRAEDPQTSWPAVSGGWACRS
jgi:hypothetical protein